MKEEEIEIEEVEEELSAKDKFIEFLMTYGWAILAAIIAIGVLWYFGVFK